MKNRRFKKIGGSAILAGVGFVAWLAACNPLMAATITSGADPNASSAFDYTNLSSITPSHAQVNATFDIRNMFGGNFAAGETIFQETSPSTIYSVTFTLNTPVQLTGYSLYLTNDGDDFSRALNRFELLQGATVLSNVAVSSTYNATYGSHSIVVKDSFSTVTASTFTARFYSGTSAFNGVRVADLDAVVAPVPEASLGILFVEIGVLALAFTRRRMASGNAI